MKALLISCTLKASPEKSNTEMLTEVVADALREEGVEVAAVRVVDHSIPPGVESEMGEDAMITETDDDERPVAYNRVAGVVVTGNEDGAHHVISEVSGAAANLLAVARALEAKPIAAPPS